MKQRMTLAMNKLALALLLLTLLSGAGCAALDRAGAAGRPAAMTAYRDRLLAIRGQIPQITAAAQAVAQRWAEHDPILMHYPFGGDTSTMSMENISRAGGLDNAQPSTVRQALRTAHDVVVMGVRSWEKGGEFATKQAAQARADGWLIVLFASRQGMPADIACDYLIDNGAVGPGEDEAAINQIVNVTNGWMFQCEVVAALSRLGKHPGVLQGMTLIGSTAHNQQYQHSNQLPELYPCATIIAGGDLSRIYLRELHKQLVDLEGPRVQKQIAQAADLAAATLGKGGKVWASSFTHVLDGEVLVNNKSPIQAFRGISCGPNGENFTKNVQQGDLLFWFGEWTVNLPWRDYLAIIRRTPGRYIPSLRLGPEPLEPCQGQEIAYNMDFHDAPMVLEQNWPLENAVVPIPFPPGKMAPVSGVHVQLLYRMLDHALAQRVAKQAAPAAAAGPAPVAAGR